MYKFIFTCGDVNGIGPEIVVKTLDRLTSKKNINQFFVICPENIFFETVKSVKPHFNFSVNKSLNGLSKEKIILIPLKNVKTKIGYPTKSSGLTAFNSIKLSFDLLKDKKADAVITAPISKTSFKLANINFPGHTELYANWCGREYKSTKADDFVMMFLSKKMKAALITIHEPLKIISDLLTKELLEQKLKIIFKTLNKDLKINKPSIAVLGLNPHAGESGLIGDEEKKVILPVINKFKRSFNIDGAFVPDAFFANHLYKKYDVVVGMYHDQVLIPFKMLNFSSGVNYTAGLPIVRTSPDHGTAFDIAGKNSADESSLYQAFIYAEKIVKNRNLNGTN